MLNPLFSLIVLFIFVTSMWHFNYFIIYIYYYIYYISKLCSLEIKTQYTSQSVFMHAPTSTDSNKQ